MASVALSLAVGLGTNLLLSILTPAQRQEGARLSDLRAPASEYGKNIPKIYGKGRVTGNIIWAQDLKELSSVASEGGKGAPSTRTTEFSYFATFAVLFAEGDYSLRKMWLNGKLVYNQDSTDPETIEASIKFSEKVDFFPGTELQEPSSIMEYFEGVDNVPAHRRYCYAVFNDLPLTELGFSTFPAVSVELQSNDGLITVGQVATDICTTAGIEEADIIATELSDNLEGLIIPQNGETYRGSLEELQQFYLFQSSEGFDGKFSLKKLSRPSVILDLPVSDLATTDYGSELPDSYLQKRIQSSELPSKLSMSFYNPSLEYDLDNLEAYRYTEANANSKDIKTNIVNSKGSTKTTLFMLLAQLWVQRDRYESIFLPYNYLGQINPGDVINLPIGDYLTPIQITELNVGANLAIEIKAVRYDSSSLFFGSEIIEDPRDPGDIDDPVFEGSSEPIIMDIPLIKDSDITSQFGIYVGATSPSGSWTGGNLYSSFDDSIYTFHTGIPREITNGTIIVGELANDVRAEVIDKKSRVTVLLDHGELFSIVESQFLNLTNLALIRDELVAFQNAVLIAPNTYELSNFIRGCRGTEHEIPNHDVNDRFVVLKGSDTTVVRVTGDLSWLGLDAYYKVVTPPEVETDVTPTLAIPILGNSVKPYAPSNLKATRGDSDGLLIEWIRRTRTDGEWVDFVDVPYSDGDLNQFEIDVYPKIGSSYVYKRTYTTAGQSVSYPISDQNTDTGGVRVEDFKVVIRQLSSYVGNQGFEAEKTFSIL